MMRRCARVLIAVAFACASAAARPEVDDLLKSLDEVLRRTTTNSTHAERAALLEDAIRARSRLIAAAGADERLATWLLDQAEAVLQNEARDGSEWSVLYGVPTPAQRRRIREAAASASALIERADTTAAATIERLEQRLFAARDDAAAQRVADQIEPRLRILIDAEQAWRLPMLRARVALLLAPGQDEPAVTERRRLGAAAYAALVPLNPPDESATITWLALKGTAALIAGDRAEAQLAFTEASSVPTRDFRAEDARLGLCLTADLTEAREHARNSVVTPEAVPLSITLLRAENAARAVLLQLPTPHAERIAAFSDALAPLASLVELTAEPHPNTDLDPLIIEKAAMLAIAVDKIVPAPAIRYARAVMLIARDDASDTRAAIELLTGVAADTTATDKLRAGALWILGSRLRIPEGSGGASGGAPRLVAATALARLHREFPSSHHARAALERADLLLRVAVSRAEPGAVPLQRDVLERLIRVDPPVPNATDFPSLLIANHALDPSSKPDATALRSLLGPLPDWPPDQQPRRAADDQNASVVIERTIAAAADLPERAALAGVAADWAVARKSALAARYRLARAEAILEADPRATIEDITAIGALDDAPLTADERLRARFTTGRAHRELADTTAAFAAFRSLADDLDHEPAAGGGGKTPKRSDLFWATWAEMLEILHEQNTAGERTATIRLQLNRLALIDPGLGPEPWRARINRIRDAIK